MSKKQVSETELSRLKDLSLMVVGDLMLDKYIWTDAQRISPEAPVPVLVVDKESDTIGGAANVAANLAALGLDCCVFGVVGTDAAGSRLKDKLLELNIQFIGESRSKTPTIVKTRVLASHQQVCRLDYEASPVSYQIVNESVVGSLLSQIEQVDAVILSDYAKGVISADLIEEVQLRARKLGKLVAIDPKPSRQIPFRGVDIMTPNKLEAASLAGVVLSRHEQIPYELICQRIWEQHKPKYLVVTLGEDGMLLSEKGVEVARIPAIAHEVFDVSGAGDTVIAILTAALAAGIGFVEAAQLANIAASIVVSKLGTATASISEIRDAMH